MRAKGIVKRRIDSRELLVVIYGNEYNVKAGGFSAKVGDVVIVKKEREQYFLEAVLEDK